MLFDLLNVSKGMILISELFYKCYSIAYNSNRNIELNVYWSRKCKSNMHLPQELIEWLLHNYSNEVAGLQLINNGTVTFDRFR